MSTKTHEDGPTRRDDIRAMAREVAATIPDEVYRSFRTTAEVHAFCADLDRIIHVRAGRDDD